MGKIGISPIPQWKPKVLKEEVSLYRKPDPELDFFHISFKHYNDDLCEVSILEKNRARQTIQNFKVIGRCHDFGSLKDGNIGIRKITPTGDYLKLFVGSMTKDTELREHEIQGDARLFYFVAEKMFNVVAIMNNHLETRKHRNR